MKTSKKGVKVKRERIKMNVKVQMEYSRQKRAIDVDIQSLIGSAIIRYLTAT